jgi:large subunit ribosomal protein L21
VAGASVAAEVLEQGRGPKVIAFKKRRRKNSRRRRGHRQEFTLVRVTEILTDGATPSKTAGSKRVASPPAEAPAAG